MEQQLEGTGHRMGGRRNIKVARGLSVIASSSLLMLAAVGTAAAHPLSIVTPAGVDDDHAALAALICAFEPCDDIDELNETIDEVLASWPEADDVAEAAAEHEDEAEVEDVDPADDQDEDEADDDEDESDDASDDESDDADEAADDEEDDSASDDDESDDESDDDEDEDESDDDESDDDEDEDED